MGGITGFFSSGKKSKSPEKDANNSSGMFARSKAKEIVQETKQKKESEVDLSLSFKEAR